MDVLKGLIDSLEAPFRKKLLFGLAGLLVLLALIIWVVLPVYDFRSELRSRQAEARDLLREMAQLQNEYQQAKLTAAAAGASRGAFSEISLFSFLENQANQDGIRGHIAYMRPSTVQAPGGLTERQVQIRLEEIRLAPFLAFLQHIEYAEEPIYVKRLTVRSPRESPGQLRIDLLLSAFE